LVQPIEKAMKNIFMTFFLALCGTGLFAQGNTGSLQGKITDEVSAAGIEMAVVKLQAGTQTFGGYTDVNGEYAIKGIPIGKYDVEISFVGYQGIKLADVLITNSSITFLNKSLGVKEGKGYEFIYEKWKEDLLGAGTPGTMKRLGPEEISFSANLRGVGDIIASSVPKVYMKDSGGDLNFSGSRSGSTLYMIDGVKVIGEPQLPNQGIAEMVVITGGLPAQFGDTTSGVVLITTKSFK
jgi:hypothetical protein